MEQAVGKNRTHSLYPFWGVPRFMLDRGRVAQKGERDA
jgi:hypothetical protein